MLAACDFKQLYPHKLLWFKLQYLYPKGLYHTRIFQCIILLFNWTFNHTFLINLYILMCYNTCHLDSHTIHYNHQCSHHRHNKFQINKVQQFLLHNHPFNKKYNHLMRFYFNIIKQIQLF